jgi:hypothetical protein
MLQPPETQGRGPKHKTSKLPFFKGAKLTNNID